MGVAVNVERLGRRIAAFEIGPRFKTRLAECERPFVLVGVEKNAAHGIDLIAPHLVEWPVLIFFAGRAGSDGLDDGSCLMDHIGFRRHLLHHFLVYLDEKLMVALLQLQKPRIMW